MSVILSEDKAVEGQRSRLLTVIRSRSKLLWGQRSRLLRVIRSRSRLFAPFWLIICKKKFVVSKECLVQGVMLFTTNLDKAWVIQGCDLVLYHDGLTHDSSMCFFWLN